MPNGADKNWVRVCSAIDGFIAKHGHPPTRVEMNPYVFANLVGQVMTPSGYALVSSIIRLVPGEEDIGVIARDEDGAAFDYGMDEFRYDYDRPWAMEHFGHAVLRDDLDPM